MREGELEFEPYTYEKEEEEVIIDIAFLKLTRLYWQFNPT